MDIFDGGSFDQSDVDYLDSVTSRGAPTDTGFSDEDVQFADIGMDGSIPLEVSEGSGVQLPRQVYTSPPQSGSLPPIPPLPPMPQNIMPQSRSFQQGSTTPPNALAEVGWLQNIAWAVAGAFVGWQMAPSEDDKTKYAIMGGISGGISGALGLGVLGWYAMREKDGHY